MRLQVPHALDLNTAIKTADTTMQALSRPASLRCGTPSLRKLQASAPARMSVRMRFKEKDDELMQRRKAEEEIIRRQEQQLRQDNPADLNSKVYSTLNGIKNAGAKPEVDAQVKVNWLQPAFTRRREVFAGRLAMVGFFAACFWECYFPSHPNIMEQVAAVGQWAGLPVNTANVALLFGGIIVHNFVFSLAPWSPTWSVENLRDVAKRPVGPPSTLVSPLNYKRFLGVTGWGFTKANELFHGRLAMLGFLAALIQQVRLGGYAGPGPLAQVAAYLGVPPDETFYAGIPSLFIGWAVFAAALAYLNGRPGNLQGEQDIY